MINFFRTCLIGVLFSCPLHASIQNNTPHLTSTERETIRFHLSHLYNQLDLMIRNQKVDRSDLKKQEGDFDRFKVFERIPLHEDKVGLKNNIVLSAQDHRVKLIQFSLRPSAHSKPARRKLPSYLYTDSSKFQLSEEQLVERIPFEVIVQGTNDDVHKWVQSWKNDQMRLTELDSLSPIQSGQKWKILAHAYQYRDIQFPKLLPQNPRTFLPKWARENYSLFSQAEPQLTEYVSKIEILTPKAAPHLKTREKFLLNDARLSFYLKTALGNGKP